MDDLNHTIADRLNDGFITAGHAILRGDNYLKTEYPDIKSETSLSDNIIGANLTISFREDSRGIFAETIFSKY